MRANKRTILLNLHSDCRIRKTKNIAGAAIDIHPATQSIQKKLHFPSSKFVSAKFFFAMAKAPKEKSEGGVHCLLDYIIWRRWNPAAWTTLAQVYHLLNVTETKPSICSGDRTPLPFIQDGRSLFQREWRVCLNYIVPRAMLFPDGNNSYIEGLVRGYRNALLTSQQYGNLIQCESVDGMWRISL